MTGKVKVGKSFSGICRYVFREDKHAVVLGAEGVRASGPQEMGQDFTFQAGQRPGMGNAVLHVALSLPAQEAAGRSAAEISELLRVIGQAYLKKMKLPPTQWALVQHTDRAHPHAHLLINRIDNQGRVIDDGFIGQRSRQACQAIEKNLGLIRAERCGRAQAQQPGPTKRQQAARTPRQHRTADWHRARHEAANILGPIRQDAGSWEVFQQRAQAANVQAALGSYPGKDGQQRPGILLERAGFRFKAAELGQEFRTDRLLRQLAQNQREQQQREQQASAREVQSLGRAWQDSQTQVTRLQVELSEAERRDDYGRIADLRYGELPSAQQQLAAHQAQLEASAAGRAHLDDLREQERSRSQVEARTRLEELRREQVEHGRREAAQREADRQQALEQAAEREKAEQRQQAKQSLTRLERARQVLLAYQAEEQAAAKRGDQARSTQLRQQEIPAAECQLATAQAQFAALPGGPDLLAEREAKRVAEAEQQRRAWEAGELAELEVFRRRERFQGYHLRVDVPVECVPQLWREIGQRATVEYPRMENAQKLLVPRPTADGRIGVNIFFPAGQDLRNLDALLTRLQAEGGRLVEQPADQARRQRHTADTYQFHREYAAGLWREASPGRSGSQDIER